ncbi:hypothetical protein [Erwinia endophytica]|nr:hypothetical protein [Erwinia endophytica]
MESIRVLPTMVWLPVFLGRYFFSEATTAVAMMVNMPGGVG